MSSEKILTNKYIPEVVPLDLPWYERDGLLTYCDQMKYKDFLDDPDSYIKNAQIINFDMIHAQCHGQPRENSDKHYQTVWAKYTNNKMNIVIKLVYLQIKHPESIYPRFLILVLNSKTELLDLTLAGRLFHIREPLK